MASLPTRWGEFFFFPQWSGARLYIIGNIILRDIPFGSISCQYSHRPNDTISNLYLLFSVSLWGFFYPLPSY